MKTDASGERSALPRAALRPYLAALLLGLLYGSGCATQDSPALTAPSQVAERDEWAAVLRRWYPEWEHDGAVEEERVPLTDEQLLWAYRLRQWYPDWQPSPLPQAVRSSSSTFRQPHRRESAAPPASRAPRVQPTPAVAPPPSAAVEAPKPDAKALPALSIQIPAPAPDPDPDPGAAGPSGETPAQLQPFKIVPEGEANTTARSYVIQRGDTLSRIAEKFYGDAGEWRRIRDANRNLITNPNQLTAGVTIRIP